MNLVDSCGWLEYFASGPNANFFAPAIENTSKLLVPTVCLYEVFKKVLSERNEDTALQTVAMMQQGNVIDLDTSIALLGAKISHEKKLPMADGLILATTYKSDAILWTQDADFKGIDGVNYKAKR